MKTVGSVLHGMSNKLGKECHITHCIFGILYDIIVLAYFARRYRKKDKRFGTDDSAYGLEFLEYLWSAY